MANKREVGNEGKKTELMLMTNVFGLFPFESKKIYRYDVTIIGWTRTERPVDFTGKISNE